LPEHWPESDRQAWVAACKPARGVRDAGAAATLRKATQLKHASEWGYYLRYLSAVGLLLPSETVADRLTPERLGDYICAIPATNRASSVKCRIVQLSYVAAVLVPGKDWAWVRRHPAMPTEREAVASQKEKAYCDPREIVPRALRLSDGAENLADPLLAAVRYRDGLLIAFGFWSTLRRKNLVELRIGESIVVQPEYIRIVLHPNATKNYSTVDMLVPDFLVPYVRRYLEKHRPILLQGACDDGALWINRDGEALSYHAIYDVFITRSQALIGRRLHPHSTRYSQASTIIGSDPRDTDLAAASLGHHGIGTVERYYNQAGSTPANAIWQRFVGGLSTKDPSM
jgi:hypothetical protein